MKDPFYQKEKLRYKKPIPSRELILKVLKEHKKPILFKSLSNLLNIEKKEALVALEKRIKAMIRDGQIIKNRSNHIVLTDSMDLCKGVVQFSKDRQPYLFLNNNNLKVLITGNQASELLQGDEIIGRQVDQNQIVVVEILSRALSAIVGYVEINKGITSLRPIVPCIAFDPILKPTKKKLKAGEIVRCTIQKFPKPTMPAIVKIAEVIPQENSLKGQIELVCDAYEIPTEFEHEYSDFENDFGQREDWTPLPFVTIDGEDARDFDDAVCVKKVKNGYEVYVAIADVTHYVKTNTSLDREAEFRGTSIYFPRFVIPMLPEILSNDLCSLRPNEVRPAMGLKIILSHTGKVTSYTVSNVLIESKFRLTYNSVQKYIQGSEELKNIDYILDPLIEVYKVLRNLKQKRGALEFNTKTTRVVFDKETQLYTILKEQSNDAHKLIEVLMLLANETVAKFLIDNKLPGIFRNHAEPDLTRWSEVGKFLRQFGIKVPLKNTPSSLDMKKILDKISQLDGGRIIEQMVLRSLPQALYEANNKGHYGLAYKHYLHFTSPIRRYPDLMVHRILKTFIKNKKKVNTNLNRIAQHASFTERRAEQATRWVDAWAKVSYMKQHVGETHNGVITNVTNFGVFVDIHNFGIDGMVHVSKLPQDYYDYDSYAHKLIGRYSNLELKVGMQIKVTIDGVDLESRKIELSYSSE